MLTGIEDIYERLYERLRALSEERRRYSASLSASLGQDREALERRRENLCAQLESIEDYRDKVKAYLHAAERVLTSRNHSTLIARELNFNRLRNWAMMMGSADPDENGDDPYARRIHYLCMCNLLYLDQKERDFRRRLKVLEGQVVDEEDESRRQKKLAAWDRDLALSYEEVLASEELNKLASALAAVESDEGGTAILGFAIRPLPVELDAARARFRAVLGPAFDAAAGTLRLPVGFDATVEFTILVGYASSKERRVFSGVQRMLAGVARAALGERRGIVLLDAVHFNDVSLNSHLAPAEGADLRSLKGTGLLADQPRTMEQLEDVLRLVVASFEEEDEAIGMFDSAAQYNATVDFERQLARRVLVLVGWPEFFSAEARSLVARVLSNQERYGISVIMLQSGFKSSRDTEMPSLPVDLPRNVVSVVYGARELVSVDGASPAAFEMARLSTPFPLELRDAVARRYKVGDGRDSTYPSCVSELAQWPHYVRGFKSIELPYGMNSKGEVSTISFDGENFAAYLMGASGSGKSTLLHDLITGIIGKYHPDDVELWLADFKMAEFSQYMDPMPPHVRYLLLDESPELVFDLIDRLTDKMMERQRFFMQHRSLRKVEDVPKELCYMPVIFVMLDEFSIMSQALAEEPAYRLKLQNLLAKGRALGIKFLFSSQQFTTGTTGLTMTAKAQVQSRIAMKNSRAEITETLELSSADKTERVLAWMNALPPHYALYKYLEGDAVRVERMQVLYFPGEAEEAFAPQRQLIDRVRSSLRAVDAYDPSDDGTYVDKHPVIVDGNSFEAFDAVCARTAMEARHTDSSEDLVKSDLLLDLGTPRLLRRTHLALLPAASRENLVLLAPPTEQSCALSVVLSAMSSAELCGARVSIWAHGRSRLFRALRASGGTEGRGVHEGIDEVCEQIRLRIEGAGDRDVRSELVVLMGMEALYPDFELMEDVPRRTSGGASIPTEARYVPGADPRADARQQIAHRWARESLRLRRTLREQGLSREEVRRCLEDERRRFFSDIGTTWEQPVQGTPVPAAPTGGFEVDQRAAYNASGDFKRLLERGSRLGLHFLLCLTSLSDLRQAGARLDLFRARLAFQTSAEDSKELFRTSHASTGLPQHVCLFDDGVERFSFRPYLHPGVGWDGWFYDEATGRTVNSFDL